MSSRDLDGRVKVRDLSYISSVILGLEILALSLNFCVVLAGEKNHTVGYEP